MSSFSLIKVAKWQDNGALRNCVKDAKTNGRVMTDSQFCIKDCNLKGGKTIGWPSFHKR